GTGRPLHTGYRKGGRSLAQTADGQRVATERPDGGVSLWDLAAMKELPPLRGPKGPARGPVFSPSGRRLAAADGEGGIWVWEVASGKVLHRFRVEESGLPRFFSADGKTLLTASQGGPTFVAWDVATGIERRRFSIRTEEPIDCIAFSPDGRTVATGS